MQTTLLGIAIALILALITALVAPLMIDWGAYRPLIEAEASRVLGTPVHIAGAIDGRLLPSPRLNLHDVSIGAGGHQMRADELDLQFALTPLMRGEWRAEDMRLAGPRATLTLDKAGRLHAPSITAGFDPDAVAIERLQVEGGTIAINNASGESGLTLHGVFFNGRARSLLGPFSGNGAFMVGDESYTVEDFSTGRINDGAVRLRVALQPVDHPFKIDGEGTLTIAEGKPRFEGNLNLAPPPELARERGHAGKPWHVRGKLTANASAALLQNLEFVYGGDVQALKLTGSVRLDLGKTPRLSAELNTPRLDLDRMLAGADGKPATPAERLRELAHWSGEGAFASSIPVSIGLSVDEVVLGGGSVLNVGGDLSSVDGGWNLRTFEFRAPGFTQVKLSGKLKAGKDGVGFTGPAVIDAGDPKTLFAWLEGRSDAAPANMRPLGLRGNVTFGPQELAIDDLTTTFDGKPVRGRIAYSFATAAEGAKLDATLNAADIDLDTALGFGKAMLSGSHAALPEEIAVKADFERASFGRFTGHDVKADVSYGRDGLNIANLSIADLGGAQFAAKGRLGKAAQHGSLSADLRAPDLKPVLAVLARFAPKAAAWLEPTDLSPATLHAILSLQDKASGQATLAIQGDLGGAHVALDATGAADLLAGSLGEMRLKGKVAADQGKLLLSLLHIDRILAVADGPGALQIEAHGPALKVMTVRADLNAAGLKANVNGRADLMADKRSADLRVMIDQANAAPLAGASGALPLRYRGRLSLAGDDVTLSDIRAGIGATKLSGKLALTLGETPHVKGELEADALDATAALAAATGLPPMNTSPRGRWVWPSEPFAPGLIGTVEGEVALKAHRVTVLPSLDARELRGKVHFGPGEIALRDVEAILGGGRLSGEVAFSRSNDGLTTDGKISLADADAATLIGSGARPPLTGALGLQFAFEGSGLSPVALVGSLHGSGKITLTQAKLAGLDPRAFDAVTRAVDDGLPIETARISDVVGKTLASGQLAVQKAEGALALAAGQMRLDHVQATSSDADLSMSGALDLTDGLIDAHLVLSGSGEAAGTRPDIYMALKGPIGAPERAIDVSALTGWLTLRAVENQARKVRMLEEAAAKDRAAREKAEHERIARQQAEEQRQARARAAAEGATGTVQTIAPTIFPPLSPPLLMPQSPSIGRRATPSVQAEAVSKNEPGVERKRAPATHIAPPLDLAPTLPPPIMIERLPDPANSR